MQVQSDKQIHFFFKGAVIHNFKDSRRFYALGKKVNKRNEVKTTILS